MLPRLLALPALGLLLAWGLFLRPQLLGGPASYIMVSGVSMEPTMYTGDLAILLKQESYAVGDVVAFRVKSQNGAEVGNVIHRIVGGSAEAGYVMQGDNKRAPDPWKPKPDDILGRMWVHVPGGGRAFAFLRQPQRLVALAGMVSALTLAGGIEVQRRRKRGDRKMVQSRGSGVAGRLAAPLWAIVAVGALALLTLAFTASAILSFRRPAERLQPIEHVRYEHTGAFEYTVETLKSTLYPEGVVGPISASTVDPGAKPAPPPLYTKLARGLDLGFTYALKGPLPLSDVSGEVSADLEIRAADGWTKTSELHPPTPFEGPTTSIRASVDFGQVLALVSRIEAETGVKATSYTVSVVPRVYVRGHAGGESFDDSFTPAFNLKVDQARIALDPELRRAQPRKTTETVARDEQIKLLGFTSSVHAARRLSALGAGLSALGLAAAVALFVVRLSRDEAATIQARYGPMLVSVAQIGLQPSTQLVHVGAMRDLARLAQRDGQIIFHQEVAPGSHLYFVQEDQTTYLYRVPKPGEES